jgi:Carboxypeptidase regulatory-like domain
MTRPALLVAIILAFAGSYASAQPPGRITGRVIDQTGAPLPGVGIEMVVHSKEVTTGTDAAGLYRFENVPAGQAELTYRLQLGLGSALELGIWSLGFDTLETIDTVH